MTQENKKFRLITRSDFDGLVCAILLKELDMIDDIKFVHPKDMQDGKIEVGPGDITTNLPYVADCHLCFDHHDSEAHRNESLLDSKNYILSPDAPSAARVVYDYYGGAEAFPKVDVEMMQAVDKADAAQFSMSDVLQPKGWELLSFLMDSRTGLGRFREFRVSNYALMMDLIDYCRDHTIEEILKLPDVQERVDLYMKYKDEFRAQIKRCAKVYDNLVVLDLRDEEIIYPSNRFMIYAMYPECNISIHVMWGFQKQNTVFATGKSIFDKTSSTHIGELMLKYNGGGHHAAGTCQVPHDEAQTTLEALIAQINSDG